MTVDWLPTPGRMIEFSCLRSRLLGLPERVIRRVGFLSRLGRDSKSPEVAGQLFTRHSYGVFTRQSTEM